MKKAIDSISKPGDAPVVETVTPGTAEPAATTPTEAAPQESDAKKEATPATATESTATTTAAPDPVATSGEAPAAAAASTTAVEASTPATPAPTTSPQPTETSPAAQAVPAAGAPAGTLPTVPPTTPPTTPAGATPTAVPSAGADTFESLFPEPSVAISGPPSWVWWAGLLVAAVLLAVAGYGLAQDKIKGWLNLDGKATPTPTAVITSASPSSTPTPTSQTSTPTPSPSASPSTSASPSSGTDKSQITLRVLNGTTVTGAAAKARTTLQSAGFTVRTIGNATNQTYATTVIYYQEGREEYAKLVQSSLTTYQTELKQSTLSNPDMVLVVIGKK